MKKDQSCFDAKIYTGAEILMNKLVLVSSSLNADEVDACWFVRKMNEIYLLSAFSVSAE